MGMSDRLKTGVRSKQALASDTVVEKFTEALTIALEKFLSRLNNGQIPIEDMTDLHRVYTMWKEIVEFNEMRNSNTGGMLPEIRTTEIIALEDSGIVSEDGNVVDLSTKSDQEMEELALNLMNAINKENEEGV